MKEFKIVFWDFDGVIKDSLTVKTEGYAKLFLPFGEKVVERIKQHHKANGGISRYDKIPLYLNWAGEPAEPNQVREYCDRFSNLVKQAVIDSPWVTGVQKYLESYHMRQFFVLITGTPQEEIEEILHSLKITHYFQEVYGAPKIKFEMVRNVLNRLQCPPEKALVVGDSSSDLEAAEKNNVAFLLRCTRINLSLQEKFSGPRFEELKNESIK